MLFLLSLLLLLSQTHEFCSSKEIQEPLYRPVPPHDSSHEYAYPYFSIVLFSNRFRWFLQTPTDHRALVGLLAQYATLLLLMYERATFLLFIFHRMFRPYTIDLSVLKYPGIASAGISLISLFFSISAIEERIFT